MQELVYLKKNDAFTDSLVIANGTGIEHRKIKSIIKKYQKKFKKLGEFPIIRQAESTGGRPEDYYVLNETQSTFLITLLKNTEIAVNFKAELARRFYKI